MMFSSTVPTKGDIAAAIAPAARPCFRSYSALTLASLASAARRAAARRPSAAWCIFSTRASCVLGGTGLALKATCTGQRACALRVDGIRCTSRDVCGTPLAGERLQLWRLRMAAATGQDSRRMFYLTRAEALG